MYKGDLKKILDKYFYEVPDNFTADTELQTNSDYGDYKIKVSEIYSGELPEKSELGSTLDTLTGYEGKNTTVQDSLGNKVIVPAGFKVYIPEGTNLEDYNVENGIIIEDVSAKDDITKGSQFVWIPTGTIHRKGKEDVTINLDRYTFASSREATTQGDNEIIDEVNEYPCQELASSSYGNNTAINIDNFLTKAEPNATGGFYIGRYESRDGIATSARTGSTGDRQVVTKAESFVYNYVTQSQAATLSQNMYTSSNFTSDLINSYAWDTAIYFLQKCDNRDIENNTPYSRQERVSSTFAPKGTNNENTKDVICNIFDIASNCYEWSTETSKNDSETAVNRGGNFYGNSGGFASTRRSGYVNCGDRVSSFRTIIYL